MGNIRVTYSGLLAFGVGTVGVLVGFFFILMVTRRLSPEEFGTWGIIISIIGYLMVSETIFNYWTTRQIARGEIVGKTTLGSSIIFSVVAIPIYLIISYFVSSSSNTNLNIMIFGVLLVPVFFISQTFKSINLGHKPQATSYGSLVFELTKIPAGLLLIIIFDLGIEGVILTMLIAFSARIAVQFHFAKEKIRDNLNFKIFRRWFRLSAIPLYTSLPPYLISLDIIIYSTIMGSVLGIAYYNVSIAIAGIVSQSGTISQALYPKLLSQETHDYLKDNLTLLMYFAIPLLGIAIIFSKAGLFALNPIYQDSNIIVVLLSFKFFFLTMSQTFEGILLGNEKADTEENTKLSKLIKSKLFLLPTVRIIHGAFYISLLGIIFFTNSKEEFSLETVTLWAWIGLILEIPIVIYLWVLVQKSLKFSFPLFNTLKYAVATLAFIIVFYFTSEQILNYKISIYDFFPSLLAQLIICLGIYLVITYFIDYKTRLLLKSIIKEIIRNK